MGYLWRLLQGAGIRVTLLGFPKEIKIYKRIYYKYN